MKDRCIGWHWIHLRRVGRELHGNRITRLYVPDSTKYTPAAIYRSPGWIANHLMAKQMDRSGDRIRIRFSSAPRQLPGQSAGPCSSTAPSLVSFRDHPACRGCLAR
jgi:hypothetical protein